MNNKSVTGIAWFNKSDWEEWKRISEDEIEDSYEEWLDEATMVKKYLEYEGYTVEKVTITPAKFKTWCKKNSRKINSESRSGYVAELLSKANS